MKLELKENMYYRTYSGSINKIASIKDFNEREYLLNGFYVNKDTIKKVSYDIIDLIEVGDYVNGYKVVKIDDLNYYDNRIGSKYIEIDFNVENDYEHWCEDTVLQNPNIKSIVTKELFSKMEYRLGDDK